MGRQKSLLGNLRSDDLVRSTAVAGSLVKHGETISSTQVISFIPRQHDLLLQEPSLTILNHFTSLQPKCTLDHNISQQAFAMVTYSLEQSKDHNLRTVYSSADLSWCAPHCGNGDTNRPLTHGC